MPALSFQESIIIYVLSIWSLVWRGIALWRCVKQGQRNWFIALLILNTVGILDIIYLFAFSKKKLTLPEIKEWFQKTFFTKPASK